MESLTHALIGASVAALSGEPAALTNPIYLGAILGSVAPDLDIVYYLRGHLPYLKHHRGFSHSIPGLALISLALTAAIKLFYPMVPFYTILLWTFLGSLSHSIMDVLNSYGAAVFLPFYKRKCNLNLLMIFDPILILLFSPALFFPDKAQVVTGISWLMFGLYLLARMLMRENLKKYLRSYYSLDSWKQSFILPSVRGLFKWDFALQKDNLYIVGQVNFISRKVTLRESLPIPDHCKIISEALKSKLANLFKEFTPHFHISLREYGEGHIISFRDLRYYLKNDFLHNGTLYLDKHLNAVEEIFHPFSKSTQIIIK